MRNFVVHCLLGLARGGKLPVNRVYGGWGGGKKRCELLKLKGAAAS